MTGHAVSEMRDRDRPVAVYCHDVQCDLSTRAAWRLETLGHDAVYDYAAGKMDWLSFGLVHEGTATLAGDLARRQLRNCQQAEVEAILSTCSDGTLYGAVATADLRQPAGHRRHPFHHLSLESRPIACHWRAALSHG
jgi:3-mercaptopyruvate sulfurtransferase SseA